MVVVFVTHNYPRNAGDLPGAFLQPLAHALRDRGHDVRVVAPADRGKGGREALDDVPVRRVRYAAPARETLAYEGRMQEAVGSLGGALAFRALIGALREGVRAEAGSAAGEVIVHAHWWIPAGLAAPPELPLVITLHGTDGRILGKNAATRWLGRRVLRRAGVVTAVSSELAAVVERSTGRRDVGSHVQPMPVGAVGRSWSQGGGGAIVVARLTSQKRVDLAIRAVAGLVEAGIPLPFTIVGDGPERRALEQLAGSLPGGGGIRFTGRMAPGEITGLLSRADLMLFPAVGEGFGLAAAEALLQGVPVVVCSDGGGVVDLARAHGGGFVTDPVPAAIAAAAQRALRAESRAEARAAGERWRAELSPAKVAERFEGWYREALDA